MESSHHEEGATKAREDYLDIMFQILDDQDNLEANVKNLEQKTNDAQKSLKEIYDQLKTHLDNSKIATTVGSATSIIGTILLFTPAAPLGVALAVGGTLTTVGTAVGQQFFLEPNATEAFKTVIENFNNSVKDSSTLFQNTKTSLENFTKAMETLNTAYEEVSAQTSSGADHVIGNNVVGKLFLFGGAASMATRNLASKKLATVLTEKGVEALGKGLKFVKFIPLLGIAIDVFTIIRTWKSDNETLQNISQLIHQVSSTFENIRQSFLSLREYIVELFGSSELQQRMKTLRRLPRPRKNNPPDPPLTPAAACLLLGAMKEMMNIPLMLFVLGKKNDDKKEDDDNNPNSYYAQFAPKSDIEKIAKNGVTAPLIESLFESYPGKDEKREGPMQSGYGSIAFRMECSVIWFGSERVYNVDGTSFDKRGKSWVKFWESLVVICANGGCVRGCLIEAMNHGDHPNSLVGGHMELEILDNPIHWYIIPICHHHNSKIYDRGAPGGVLTTVATAWAVKMPVHENYDGYD